MCGMRGSVSCGFSNLVMNTLGGFVGALISMGVRKVVGREGIDFRPIIE